MGKLGNIVSATKMFLNLLGNIFASREANFFFRNNVSRGGQTGKHGQEAKCFRNNAS